MNPILIVVLLVGLVWGAVVFLRGRLLGGCLVVLLAGACFGHPFFHRSFGPVPLTLDRLLWVILLVQYVIWRRMGLTERKPPAAAEFVLLAFFGVLFLSTFSHDWQAHHHQPVARLLFSYLMPLGLYCVARQIPLSERGALVIFGSLAAFGLYLAVTAVAETHEWWWMVYPRYIGSTTQLGFLGRARGPLLNPAGSGLIGGACLAAVLVLWPRLNRPGRLLLVAGALLVCLGIYSTFTRSVWIGAGLGLFLLLALAVPRSWRLPVLGSLLLGVALVGATQWERILVFKRDRDLAAHDAAESVKLRPVLAVVAWNMFLDRPWVGCGFGQYDDEQIYYLADRSSGLRLEKARPFAQHNVFLSLLAETGVVGLGLFLTLWGLWIRDAWRVWRSRAAPLWARQLVLVFFVLLANYFAVGMFQDLSLIAMVNMVLFFLAGITAGLRPYAEPAETLGDERPEAAATRGNPLVLGPQPIA
ncbi:MAG: O-antigen ligase family protein [Planctomycetota bacterium]